MRICILTCSSLLNYGNEFINIGCLHLIRSIHPNIEHYELLDSAIDNGVLFPEYMATYVNTFDYVIVVAGSLISSRAKPVFDSLIRKIIKPKKILLGVGCFLYDKEEEDLCKKIENHFDYIITRDDVTSSFFTNKNRNIYLGLDLAFFAKDSIRKVPNSERYMVVNIEQTVANLRTHSAYYNAHKKRFDHVYNVENTCAKLTKNDFGNFKFLNKNYLFFTSPIDLYRFYQNASYVLTTRIHTLLVCLSNQVLVKYVGMDQGGSSGRLALFDRFFKVQTDREYYIEDLSIIDYEKWKLAQLLKEEILK